MARDIERKIDEGDVFAWAGEGPIWFRVLGAGKQVSTLSPDHWRLKRGVRSGELQLDYQHSGFARVVRA